MGKREWTDAEIEEARLFWNYDAKGSYKETSEHTGIPERTLYYWAKRDNWATKRQDELHDAAGPAVAEFRAEVKLTLSTALRSLATRMENTKNDDWYLKALAFLYAVAREPDETHSGVGMQSISLTDAKVIVEGEPDISKLRSLASSSMEANFMQGKVSRQRRGIQPMK
jgi:hypothetical protein